MPSLLPPPTFAAWDDLVRSHRPRLASLRVAVYASGGAPYHHAALAALWGNVPQPLSAERIRAGGLEDFDVIVFPGGGARATTGLLRPLGVEGAEALRAWVARGGMYVGSCAGSFLPTRTSAAYQAEHPEVTPLHMVCARLSNDDDSAFAGLTSPGVGTVELELADPGHWLVDGLPQRFPIVHYNGPMFVADESVDPALGQPQPAARFLARGRDFTPSEAFLDPGAPEAAVFDRGVAAGALSALSADFGDGTVVLFGSHPEFGFDALQLGWGEGVRLFANALLRQAQRRAAAGAASSVGLASSPQPLRLEPARWDGVPDRLRRLTARFIELSSRAGDLPWLEHGQVPAFLGRSPRTLWCEALDRAAQTSTAAADTVGGWLARGATFGPGAAAWLDQAAPPDQDFGAVGVLQLLDAIETAVQEAVGRLEQEPPTMQHAYDHFLEHPYHLLVGSYLGATGLVACLALALTVVEQQQV